MPNAFAYIRVSTDKQQNSLDCQADTCRKTAAYLNVELTADNLLVDEARSGTTRLSQRPAGKLLLARVQAGDIVIVTAVDRIARNLRDLLRVVDTLVEKGVRIHVINFGGASLDMTSAVGRLMVQILGAVAEFERNILVERTRAVIAFRKGQGQPVSKYSPPGQEKSKLQTADGEPLYVYSQKEWDLMAEVYRRHDLLHETFYSIGRDFQRRGLKTNNGGEWVRFRKDLHGANTRPMEFRYRVYKDWLEHNEGRTLECNNDMVFVPVAGPVKPRDAPKVARPKLNGQPHSLLSSGSSSLPPSSS
jgi:putative DNA-invertase from lambdoid prophage Rac